MASNFRLHTVSSKEKAVTQLTEKLNGVLSEARQEHISVLLLVSGGSAFDLFPLVDVLTIDEHVTIGVLDERYSRDPKENNFAQLQQTEFYRTAKDKGAHFIDTTVQDDEEHEAHAKRFGQVLTDWKKENPDGVVVATVGIGPDGHTSGVLPCPENPELFTKLFEDPGVFVAAYDAEGKNPYRYRSTTTNTFLREYIDHAFVYAVGENKKDALSRVIAETGDLPTTPARVLREMKSVDLFTDVVLE
ncbi:MAG TPA: 6-phosphogluconolactonase [Patescibacteria group bacterium]|nr:6-phosphogluconolactonase [Patescibacteria group bacterium]